jgi:DNA topoisomerase-1
MTHLVIVESPNKCKKIQAYLGPGWTVKASLGHVRDLPPKEMGVDLETFQPHYVANEKGRKVIAGLRKQCDAADQVYLATDPDREGEAIAWHLQQALKLKAPISSTLSC